MDSMHIFISRAARVLALTMAMVMPAAGAQEKQALQRPVVGTCNFSPVVDSLDRSMAFYRTVTGLEFGNVSTMGPAQKVFLDIHGVPVQEATFRWVIGRFGQMRCGIEPLEWGNIDRTPVEAQPQDPGMTTAVVVVRDLRPVVARLKAAHIAVVSAGGNAVTLANGAAKAVMVKDPDGHFVEVREEKGAADAAANVTNWYSRITVKDTEASLELYRDRLGFAVQPSAFVRDKAFADLNGVRDVPVRITRATLPDGPALELVEFKDLMRTPIHARIQDPGATRLQLMTPDARVIGPLFRATGGEVVSTRGEIFPLGDGRGGAPPTQVALARDMNGVYWEIVQRPAPASSAPGPQSGVQLAPIPDKLVVLTFDDAKASHYTVVRPLLKKYGFGATFFVSEGFTFGTNKNEYLTWEQIGDLHRDGFEIGNHTRDHRGVSKANLPALRDQVQAINDQCAAHGIPRPVSFAYPGNAIEPSALPVLETLGFRFARRGGAPEYPYEEGNGVAYEPGRDHPLLLPTTGDARPFWTLENLKRAVSQAKNGKIAILQFHGAPDVEHPWVNTASERFEEYMKYLHDQGFQAIAVRDLARYVDWRQKPDDPWQIIEQRKRSLSPK